MKINLAIVEDNADLLRNLQLILSYCDELHIAAVFTNAEDCMAAFDTLAVDVVIMDINLPGKSGIYAVETLKPMHEKVQFLMCTIYEDEEHIFQALCAGASGYILKNTAPEKFLQAIKDIHLGGSPMSVSYTHLDVYKRQQFSNGVYRQGVLRCACASRHCEHYDCGVFGHWLSQTRPLH